MQSVKPTRSQRSILQDYGLDPREWWVQKDTSTEMQVINIKTQEVKVLPK